MITLAIVMTMAPAGAQRLGQGDDVDVSLWRMALAVCIILAIGTLGLFVARARGGRLTLWVPGPERRLKVIETARLTPQASLCLVEFDGREFLLAVSAGTATVIVGGKGAEGETR